MPAGCRQGRLVDHFKNIKKMEYNVKSVAMRQRVRTVPADQTLYEIWNNLSNEVYFFAYLSL